MSQTPLLDKLRTVYPDPPWWIPAPQRQSWRKHREILMDWLRDPQLPAFNIDAIAHYYYEVSDRENWDIGGFPGLNPPYGCCWMEHALPRRIHSETGDSEIGPMGEGHAGWLLMSAKREDVIGEGIPDNTRRVLCCELFVHYAIKRSTQGPHGTWSIAVDEKGSAIDAPWLQTWCEEKHADHLRVFQGGFLNVALMAISDLATTICP